MIRGDRTDSIGTCSLCGYHGPGPRHECKTRPHINSNGEFQSDKYPTCPPGKVPLSVKDPSAQDLLWDYAQRRRAVDAEFADDLELALRNAGYVPGEKKWGVMDLAGSGWDWAVFCSLWQTIGVFFAIKNSTPEERADSTFLAVAITNLHAQTSALAVMVARLTDAVSLHDEDIEELRGSVRRLLVGRRT